MSPTLKLVLLIVFIVAAVNLAFEIKRLKRVNEIKRINNSPDVMSVEAEIIEIQFCRCFRKENSHVIEI